MNCKNHILKLLLSHVTVEEINRKRGMGEGLPLLTPLMVAVAKSSEWVIGALLLHGADPSIQNDDGETARDIAVRRNAPNILRIFDQEWTLDVIKGNLQEFDSTRSREKKIEEKEEKAKEVPQILERHKGVLSYSIIIGLFLAFLSTVLF